MEQPVIINNRTTCLACGAALTAPVFVSGNFPASAQNIPSASELPMDHGIELRLRRCEKCGLHQFDCAPVDYYKKVIRAVGLSPTMRELRRKDYAHLIDTYGLSEGSFIECGCGNGDFLDVLQEFPVKITGIEADRELAADALEKLTDKTSPSASARCFPKVYCMFTDRPDQQIPGAPFDCFLSFNFLEHQPDPLTMLRCMFHNLRDGGYGLITVPGFEYIVRQARYYELIRDHIANYDQSSLIFLCERAGFTVIEQGTIGIGDTLRVVVQKPVAANAVGSSYSDTCNGYSSSTSGINAAESIVNTECLPNADRLRESLTRISCNVAAMVKELNAGKKTLALWGAGHQGFTIASTTELKNCAKYIIDSAAFKQGLYAPASHLPIVGPDHYFEEPVDVILVAAPGYVKEISETIRNLYKEKAPEIRSILDL